MKMQVILVHGTWGCSSSWTKPGSFMRESLRRTLGEGTVFRLFAWTGWNTHAARLRAGRRLGRVLRSILEADSTNDVCVVAHSHGGNVACYALGELGVLAKRVSLVTLATPFLHFRARSFSQNVRVMIAVASMVIATVGVPLIAVPMGLLLLASPVFLILPFGGGIDFVRRRWRSLRKLNTEELNLAVSQWLERKQSQVMRTLVLPALPDVVFLSVQEKGDEARIVLGLSRWLAGVPFKGLAISLRMAKYALWAGLVICEVILISVTMKSHAVPDWSATGLIWAIILCSFGLALMIASEFAIPLFAVFGRVGFGPIGFAAALSVECSVRGLPEGWNAARYLSLALVGGKGGRGFLRHTRIYNDQGVVEKVCHWLTHPEEVVGESGADFAKAGHNR